MRSDTTFATTPTTTTMDTRDTLLAKLGSTSLENLREILAAVCLRQADKDDNHDNNSTNQDANNITVCLPDQEPQDLKIPKEPPHVGIFAQAYATKTRTLTSTQTSTPSIPAMCTNTCVQRYLHRTAAMFCGMHRETMPSIAVLHGIAVH